MGLFSFDERERKATTATLDADRARGAELSPSQKAAAWTRQAWIAAAEPVLSMVGLGLGLWVAGLPASVSPMPGLTVFATFFVVAFTCVILVRFGLRVVKQRLLLRLVKTLDEPLAAMGGTTSAGLPSLPR